MNFLLLACCAVFVLLNTIGGGFGSGGGGVSMGGAYAYRLNCDWACRRDLLQRTCNCPPKDPKRSNAVEEFDYDALFDSPLDNGRDGVAGGHADKGSALFGEAEIEKPSTGSRTSLFRWGKRSQMRVFSPKH